MAALLPFTILAASATVSAEYTTSFWQPSLQQFSKLGYLGSVQDAATTSGVPIATVSMTYDAGVDTSALKFFDSGGNYTIGPQTFGYGSRPGLGPQGCTRPDASKATVTCSLTYPPNMVRAFACETNDPPFTTSETVLRTYTYTYPARLSYSSGVETVTETRVRLPDPSTTPDWCSDANYTPEPSADTFELSGTEIWTQQLVITAGVEKLGVDATATAPASTKATGEPSGTATQPRETNAAVGSGIGGSVFVGLGAAVAVVVL